MKNLPEIIEDLKELDLSQENSGILLFAYEEEDKGVKTTCTMQGSRELMTAIISKIMEQDDTVCDIIRDALMKKVLKDLSTRFEEEQFNEDIIDGFMSNDKGEA